MQPPLASHSLTEADLDPLVTEIRHQLRFKYNVNLARRSEPKMGNEAFEDIVKVARAYTARCLGFKGGSETEVQSAIGLLKHRFNDEQVQALFNEMAEVAENEIRLNITENKKFPQAAPARAKGAAIA